MLESEAPSWRTRASSRVVLMLTCLPKTGDGGQARRAAIHLAVLQDRRRLGAAFAPVGEARFHPAAARHPAGPVFRPLRCCRPGFPGV
jgi:hypothetical protein